MTTPVLLVGLGAVGMGYDFALAESGPILTHARAFDRHPEFELTAAVDPAAERRAAFTERYGRPAYASVAEALTQHDAAVIVIASPTRTHADVVRQVVTHGSLRVILCEKPLAYDIADACEMCAVAAARDVALAVNFMRRADSAVIEVARRLRDGSIASPVKGVAWYSKGFLHNGSHLIDTLVLWLGDVQSFRVIERGRDCEHGDADLDVRIMFERGEMTVLAAREEQFSHLAMELVAPNGLLRYDRGGEVVTWRHTERDTVFSDYTLLSAGVEQIESDLLRAQWRVADELARLLRGEPCRLPAGEDALRTQEWMHRIMDAR